MNEKGEYTTSHDPYTNTFGHMDINLEVAQHHTPPSKKILNQRSQIVKKTESEFVKEIEECLDYFRDLGCTPQILVAFHNYNVGFQDSLIAAAHWSEDLNVAGPTISYSWPSAGKKGKYEPDAASMERSEPEILEFLTKISPLCGSENVHLVTDGTACHGLLRVLQRMASDNIELKLGQIFLLAPDVDQRLFMDLSWLFPKFSTRTTLYASRVDRDCTKSVKRHQAPRAGIFEPYTIVDGIDTIAIPSLETDDLVVEKKTRTYEIVTLFYDMYDLMKSNAPPSRRLHLSKQVDDGKTFWKLRKL
jgi:esterase/lipase superfamily enzyme